MKADLGTGDLQDVTCGGRLREHQLTSSRENYVAKTAESIHNSSQDKSKKDIKSLAMIETRWTYASIKSKRHGKTTFPRRLRALTTRAKIKTKRTSELAP